MDNQPMLDPLWHVLFRWHSLPNQVTGDMTYGTAKNNKAIEDAHIHAYISIAERGQRTGYYRLAHFTMIPSMTIIPVPKDTYCEQHIVWIRRRSAISRRCGYLQCLSSEGSMYRKQA